MKIIHATTLKDLYSQIAELPQRDGDTTVHPAYHKDEGGDLIPYVELSVGQEYQEGERVFAEKVVALKMSQKLNALFEGKDNGTIIWCTRPEDDVWISDPILAYRKGAPHKDLITDRECFRAFDWFVLKLYMRLAVV